MKNNQKTIIENDLILNANSLKRAGAFIIDVVITIVIMFILSLAIHPLLNATLYDYDTNSIIYERNRKASFLVTLNAPLNDDQSNIDEVNIKKDSVAKNTMAEATYSYYMIYVNNNLEDDKKMTNDYYLEHILKIDTEESVYVSVAVDYPEINPASDTSQEAVPTFDPFLPSGASFKTGATDEEINAFILTIYTDAGNHFRDSSELYTKLVEFASTENTLLLILGTSIIFLAVPLFTKNGQTVGKLATKIGVTTKYGFKVNSLQLLLRYLAFVVINIFSNSFIILVFPFVSLTIMVMNKKGMSLHDMIAGTRVVDLNNSRIFIDQKDFESSKNFVESNGPDVNEELFNERFDERSGA